MTAVLVGCNLSDSDTIPPTTRYDKLVRINPMAPQQNLQVHIDNITHRILSELDPVTHDLIEIASYIYYADCSVKRGTDADIYADRWPRKFEFLIPVSDPKLWDRPDVKNLLTQCLEFLSGDKFSFTFLPPKPEPTQLYFHFPDMPAVFPNADCISLFSGGLDSLIGTLFLVKERSLNPLLVSHRSIPKIDSLQKRLVTELRERNQDWQFPHLSIWINRKANRSVETTQRTRSFLYCSIAAAAAAQLSIKRICICENGVVSLNLPISGQNVGSYLTRSTHPKFLKLFQQLIQNLFRSNITVENPFIFLTKTEMLRKLKSWGQASLVQATVSCSYTQGRTRMQPQCGTCFQCVNRRFSIAAAAMEVNDKPEFYEKDVFAESLCEGRETVFAEGYVRSALEINDMNDVQFFAKHPEVDEAVSEMDISPDESGRKLYQLFQRHAQEVIEVVGHKLNKYKTNLMAGKLPDNCLISMLASRHHLRNPLEEFAAKIGRMLTQSLRINFQTQKPDKEPRLQEATEALLAAAGQRLRRESPMLSYSIVQTKPDFSNITDSNRLLFIELKLVNKKGKIRKIVTEITSRITIYRDQGAFVLFVVYDTDDFIINNDEFVSDFEKHDKIKVIVVR